MKRDEKYLRSNLNHQLRGGAWGYKCRKKGPLNSFVKRPTDFQWGGKELRFWSERAGDGSYTFSDSNGVGAVIKHGGQSIYPLAIFDLARTNMKFDDMHAGLDGKKYKGFENILSTKYDTSAYGDSGYTFIDKGSMEDKFYAFLRSQTFLSTVLGSSMFYIGYSGRDFGSNMLPTDMLHGLIVN